MDQEDFLATKHSDPADQASDLEADFKNANVRAVQDKVKPKQYKRADGSWPDPDCVDCGAPIGDGRLEATGSDICIDCANRKEKKGKFYGH